jgi:hypothetical protein
MQLAKKPYAQVRLEEVLTASPEVRPDARKAFELLAGATAGHRIGKYGVMFGLTPLFQILGEATASPAIKQNASLIGQGVAGTISLLGVLFLRGKWTRALAWGGLFQSVEAGLDAVEAMLLAR